jgi:ferredoxin
LDYHIGAILQKLKDLGLYENTTVVVTSDHGDMCGNHKMFDKHYVLYEDVTHVPFVIKPACGSCAHKELCGVCAAVCYTETGSFDKVPSYLCRKTQEEVKITQEVYSERKKDEN